MSLNFDAQALFRRSGADIAMFLTAMLAYWILQRVKARSAQPCKEKPDEECPSHRSNEFLLIQTPPPMVRYNKTDGMKQQHQPKHEVSEKGKALQRQPTHPLPEKKPFNVSDQLALMRNHAAARNIKDTLQGFRLIQQHNEPVTSAMHNTVMQAWINCGNIWAAENCLEEVREAGLADETSFVVLIKALLPIGDHEKARILLQEMKEKVPLPKVATFDELLLCFAKGGLFNDGTSLLRHMHDVGVQPAQSTLCAIAKLVNGARYINQRCSEVWQALSKYGFDSKCVDEVSLKFPSELPRLLAVITQAEASDSKKCFHDVEIKGSSSEIKALRVTMTKHDFLSKLDDSVCGNAAWPLEGQRDTQQDEAKRAQMAGALRCVSTQGLCLPWNLEQIMLQYLGSDVHFLRLNFESASIRAPMVDEISCRHPRLGFRHCWVKPSSGSCGQRTFSNGEEIVEAAFTRHINAGY